MAKTAATTSKTRNAPLAGTTGTTGRAVPAKRRSPASTTTTRGQGSTPPRRRAAGPAQAPVVTLPRILRRRSSLHGWGVFAQEDIPKNKRIVAYAGEKISHKESLARERRYIRTGNIWCFKLNNRWVIDASVGGNDARFINHSCRPNCYTQIVKDTIWVRAGRNIRAGEELTYNYYTDGEGLIQCRCQPGCKSLL